MTDKINIKLTGFALLVPFVDVAQDSAIVQALDLQCKFLKNRILKVISKFKYFCSCLNLMDQSLTNPGGREKPSVRPASSNGITRLRICF